MLHKAIVRFEDYLISDTGQVYSLKVQRYLKRSLTHSGYYKVNLLNKSHRKTCKVHRLVAEAFILNPDNKPTVDHINRIKTDNRVENLRWATQKEQIKNRDFDFSKMKEQRRIKQGKVIIERINNEVSIGYLSMGMIPHNKTCAVQKHVNNGEEIFTCNGRTFITEGVV